MERGACMDTRNTVEITINGRKYRLSGNESPAYMQKVADYINSMYEKLKALPGFTGRSHDYQTMMMYLNLADEYLKKSGWTEEKQAAVDTKAAEDIYRLKMELVEARKQAEAAEASRSEETLSLKRQLEVVLEEKKRLADRDRDFSARISGMEKDVDSYKTEISILKRKISDYEKNAEQVDKQLKEAAAREREEKLLRNKYETQLSRQKADYEARLDGLQKQLEDVQSKENEKIAAFEEQMTGEREEQARELAALQEKVNLEKSVQEEKLAAARKQLSALQSDHETRAAEMQKQLAAMKAGYEVKLEAFQKQFDQQEADHENQLVEMRAEYENRISSMKPGYENLLTEQESEYEAKLAEQESEYEAKLAEQKESYEARLAEQEKAIRGHFAQEKAELFRENGELMKEKRQLQQKVKELTDKIKDSENDMIEYLDLIDEKDKEIASLKFRLQEEHYE